MRTLMMAILVTLIMTVSAFATEGMIDVRSSFDVKETADRLESVLKDKGMTLFNRINHSEAAKQVGMDLRETVIVIFGNPKVGSPLMKCRQRVAIDLPQKALIWKDDNDNTWISYNNPRYLQKRHNICKCEEVVLKIEKALAGIAKAAATKEEG